MPGSGPDEGLGRVRRSEIGRTRVGRSAGGRTRVRHSDGVPSPAPVPGPEPAAQSADRVERVRQPALGLAASAAAAAAWGVAAIFVKVADVPALILTLYRLWVATAILFIASLATRRTLRWRHLAMVIPGGILLAADMACFFSAVKLTSIADVTVIAALQPALVLLVAGRMFGEMISRTDIAWTALAIAGVSVVVLGPGLPSSHHLAGDFLAVASLLAWAGYFVVSKRARQETGALEYTFGVTLVGAVVLLPVVLISGEGLEVSRAQSWMWIGLLAVVPGTGHLLMNWAHRSVEVSVSSVVGASNPVFAAGAAWIFLHQTLDVVQVAGGVVGIAAIGVVAGRKRIAPAVRAG
jgi:drug/metabolite transporter (DMT)-like permease